MLVASDLADDPAQFQHLKNVKQWTMEGVQMFNFKPKKVSEGSPSGARRGPPPLRWRSKSWRLRQGDQKEGVRSAIDPPVGRASSFC